MRLVAPAELPATLRAGPASHRGEVCHAALALPQSSGAARTFGLKCQLVCNARLDSRVLADEVLC
jgi:hypothetical protein